jgi:hypothetical protein
MVTLLQKGLDVIPAQAAIQKISLDTRCRGYDERVFHTKAGIQNECKSSDSSAGLRVS